MIEWEINIAGAWNDSTISRAVERVAKAHELSAQLKCELRSFPGSVHWHFKKPRESGTIEITMWPQKRRLWMSVQSGRQARWIGDAVPTMINELQRALGAEQ
jgi:hypothetical protein